MRQKATAPAGERKQPDTFCWTLTMRISRSAWELDQVVNYTVSISRRRNVYRHASLSSFVRPAVRDPQLPPQLGRISCHFLRGPGSCALAPSGLDEPGVTCSQRLASRRSSSFSVEGPVGIVPA